MKKMTAQKFAPGKRASNDGNATKKRVGPEVATLSIGIYFTVDT